MLKITIQDTRTGRTNTYAGEFTIIALYDETVGGAYGTVEGVANPRVVLKTLMALDTCREHIFKGHPEIRLMYGLRDKLVAEQVCVDLTAINNQTKGGGEA